MISLMIFFLARVSPYERRDSGRASAVVQKSNAYAMNAIGTNGNVPAFKAAATSTAAPALGPSDDGFSILNSFWFALTGFFMRNSTVSPRVSKTTAAWRRQNIISRLFFLSTGYFSAISDGLLVDVLHGHIGPLLDHTVQLHGTELGRRNDTVCPAIFRRPKHQACSCRERCLIPFDQGTCTQINGYRFGT